MRPQQVRDLLADMDKMMLIVKPGEWKLTDEQYTAMVKLFPNRQYKGVPFSLLKGKK